jgi:hypothetical protein
MFGNHRVELSIHSLSGIFKVEESLAVFLNEIHGGFDVKLRNGTTEKYQSLIPVLLREKVIGYHVQYLGILLLN